MTAVATRPDAPTAQSAPLRELAIADATRYARHPLFLLGLLLTLGLNGMWLVMSREPDPVAGVIMPAFFLGVFGFVVAHRLTTSLRRTDELIGALPSSRRRRTLALCLACTVPFLAGMVAIAEVVVLAAAYPPVPVPVGAPMVWFGHESWSAVAALLAIGPVTCLGGPLLGVVVGSWAPFRGSALIGAVLLLVGCTIPASGGEFADFWRVLPPFAALVEEKAVDDKVVSSTLLPGLSPQWYLVYILLLCALCVVAALLRDREGRRPLVWTALGVAVAAAGALALTIG